MRMMWLNIKTRLFKVSYELCLIYTAEPLPQRNVSMLALVEISNVNKISRCSAQFYYFVVNPFASEQMDFMHPSYYSAFM